MTKEKLFVLKLELEEMIPQEEILLLPLFSNTQICSGVDGIKSTLDTFIEQLHKFLDTVIIPNILKK